MNKYLEGIKFDLDNVIPHKKEDSRKLMEISQELTYQEQRF